MRISAAVIVLAVSLSRTAGEGPSPVAVQIETEFVRYSLTADAYSLAFLDKRANTDYAVRSPLASLTKAGKRVPATALAATPAVVKPGQTARLDLQFGDTGVAAVLRLRVFPAYFTVQVASINDESIEELTFFDLRTSLKAQPDEPLALVGMALNLKTKVPDYPRPVAATQASCYPRFGLAGASLAVVACPPQRLRQVMQEVVSAAPDLPHSPLGGPWALDAPLTRGSYLFNFGGLSEDTVDAWIKCAQSLGFTQIDFHGGSSFRFGDFAPNPQTYPRGYASLKAVIDKLHASGIQAGLHTYSFFIAKNSPYVTPVPDPRLAKSGTFTLAAPLSEAADTVIVAESTEGVSAVTGFAVRNGNSIQIDEELITFTGVSSQPPYAFTGCKRGAWGTRVAAHPAGARVHRLAECFGLFAPDPETTLLTEIAAKTAEIYNECGFDMIYLDALDGEDVLGGAENGWHYGSRFVFELWRRLKKPALMEMSTFHHHLWYVRSRLGAWDHPNRSHKRFIDVHCAANEGARRMFLPTHLGWWALRTWTGPAGEPTFPDDIEYLCCKALAHDSSLSLMGINPDNYQSPGLAREVGPIFREYEALRLAGQVPEPVKAALRVPGDEFTLISGEGGQRRFQPIAYAKHKVEGLDGWSDRWEVSNRWDEQPAQLRIQALMSAGAYDAAESRLVADFAAPDAVISHTAAGGVTARLEPSTEQVKAGAASAKITAVSSLPGRQGSWAKWGQVFSPPLNLSATQALGVWVYGDGQGEVLNVQLRTPAYMRGVADHYIVVDFKGWRYFELIEPEGERHADYVWPYGGVYAVYRETVNFTSIEEINLWINHLPPQQEVVCYLSPIRAMPLAKATLTNPSLTLGGKTITFPVALESGCYLEYRSGQDCRLFDPQGNPVAEVTPAGEAPLLPAGQSEVRFACTPPPGLSARANVWVISRGQPLPGM